MGDDLNLLFESLRSENSATRREEIVLSALKRGVSPGVLESMLDRIEFERNLCKHHVGAPNPKPLPPNRWSLGQFFGRVNHH